MFYVDSQRTITRRDSSLITIRQAQDSESRRPPSVRAPSTTNLYVDSMTSLSYRRPGTVRTEIITLLFESMFDNIVKSWKTIKIIGTEDEYLNKSLSDVTLAKKKKPGRK